MALCDLVVVEIMRRGDLDATAAERRIDIRIADDGHVPIRERQAHTAADQMPVTLIIGVHGDRRVAQHGLRPGGRDDEKAVAIAKRIAQVPQMAHLLFGDHLQIGQRGLEHWIPIDQPFAAIDQSLCIQAHEGFGHRLRKFRIHGELLAPPIDRCAQAAQLLRNQSAGGVLPFPDASRRKRRGRARCGSSPRRSAAAPPPSVWRCRHDPCPVATGYRSRTCADSG